MVPSDFASRLRYTARLTVFMLFVAVNQHLSRSRGHNLKSISEYFVVCSFSD